MGVPWSFFVKFYWFFVTIGPFVASTICDEPGCNCTIQAASWKTLNCTLTTNQDLVMPMKFVPTKISEMYISGGANIIFGPESISTMPALGIIRIDGSKRIVLEKQSVHNLTSFSLLIQIQNCDSFNVKTGAFKDMQGTTTVEVTKCQEVSVEQSAFKKLLGASFQHIGKMSVTSGTFEGSTDYSGPATKLFFYNVTIPKIPEKTFSSSLAEIKFDNCDIVEFEQKAFTALQISSVVVINSKIDSLKSGAFGPTLIFCFKISNCTIGVLESRAIMEAGITNFTVEYSRIADIQSGAINSTVATIDIIGNEIVNIRSSGLVFHNWNRINVEQNIIKFLHPHFIVAPVNQEIIEQFSFNENDVYNLHTGALSFVPQLGNNLLIMKNNFFNQTCHCSLDEWIEELITANITFRIKQIMNTTFCKVTTLLAKCFDLQVDPINMENFTELVCNSANTIVCEPYNGQTKIVNTTSKIFASNNPPNKNTWVIVIIAVAALCLLIVVIVTAIVLIRGSRWLQGKGYFTKIQTNQNDQSHDEENTIETVDESDKMDISEDLTMELLQDLSKKLDDPNTHQEASELIEQLYQKYIRNTGAENNNQQEEEAHLYEELGNLQSNKEENGPRSILKLMEEKFNTQFEDIDAEENNASALVGEYSEPSDAAVHLYSELDSNKENQGSLTSRGSSTMAFRPLPEKPGSSKMHD